MDLPLSVGSASGLSSVGSATAAPASGGGVALLLDWGNIRGCVRQEGDAAPKLKALLATARQYGPLAVARAYADWGEQSHLGGDPTILVRHAIEPVYTIGGGLKNSADIRLAVDAIALCERSPEITSYIIGSGDGGLISVVNCLRLRGRQVIVIAADASLSSYLRDAADVALCYGAVIAPTVNQPSSPAHGVTPRTPSVKPPKASKGTPGPKPAATPTVARATPATKPTTVPTDEVSALEQAFAALPRAVVTARLKSKHGVAPYPAVQLVLQRQDRLQTQHARAKARGFLRGGRTPRPRANRHADQRNQPKRYPAPSRRADPNPRVRSLTVRQPG